MFILSQILTPESIKNIINKELTTLTHQKTHIDGTIVWQVFPYPRIKVTKIYVGEEKSNAPYAFYIDSLLLNLNFTPLLKGHLVFNELKVDGLKLSIYPESTSNIALESRPPSLPQKKNTTETSSATFAINSFLLTHGQVVLTQPHASVTLSDLQIGATHLNVKNEDFPLQMKTNLAVSNANNTLKSALTYKGKIRLNGTTFTSSAQALQQMAMEGQFLAQNTRINQFKITKIRADAVTKHGNVILNPLNVSIYAGESIGDLTYQINTKKLTLNQTATHIDAYQLFKDLAQRDLLQGNLDLSVHASTILQEGRWQDNLQGNGSLTIKEGSLSFIDFNKLINEMSDKMHTLLHASKEDLKNGPETLQMVSTATQTGSTKFQLLSTQYRLVNGMLINDALLLQTDRLQLKGATTLNLNTENLNGHLFAKLATKDKTIEEIQQLLGGNFPLSVSGTFAKPIILPNANEITPIISQYLVKKTIEKPIKQIQQQLESVVTVPENLFHDHLE